MGSLSKFKPTPVQVEIDGESFYLISMNGERRAKYRDQSGDKIAPEVIVSLCLCDESGKLEYDIGNDSHMSELREVDGSMLEKIALKAFEVCGLTKKDEAEAEKN